jgi:hypothetical protein
LNPQATLSMTISIVRRKTARYLREDQMGEARQTLSAPEKASSAGG